jgi:hypothetical protein
MPCGRCLLGDPICGCKLKHANGASTNGMKSHLRTKHHAWYLEHLEPDGGVVEESTGAGGQLRLVDLTGARAPKLSEKKVRGSISPNSSDWLGTAVD